MAILKIRDENGVIHEIAAIKGEPGKSGSAVIPKTVFGNAIRLPDALAQDVEVKPYSTPAGFNKYGRNLLSPDFLFYSGSLEEVGVTASQDNGWFVLNGVASSNQVMIYSGGIPTKGTWCLSINNTPVKNLALCLTVDSVGTFELDLSEKTSSHVVFKTEQAVTCTLRFQSDEGIAFNNFRFQHQLELGSRATGYLPFVPSVYYDVDYSETNISTKVTLDGSDVTLIPNRQEGDLIVTYNADGFYDMKVQLGDLESSLDGIISIQEALIGGASV